MTFHRAVCTAVDLFTYSDRPWERRDPRQAAGRPGAGTRGPAPRLEGEDAFFAAVARADAHDDYVWVNRLAASVIVLMLFSGSRLSRPEQQTALCASAAVCIAVLVTTHVALDVDSVLDPAGFDPTSSAAVLASGGASPPREAALDANEDAALDSTNGARGRGASGARAGVRATASGRARAPARFSHAGEHAARRTKAIACRAVRTAYLLLTIFMAPMLLSLSGSRPTLLYMLASCAFALGRRTDYAGWCCWTWIDTLFFVTAMATKVMPLHDTNVPVAFVGHLCSWFARFLVFGFELRLAFAHMAAQSAAIACVVAVAAQGTDMPAGVRATHQLCALAFGLLTMRAGIDLHLRRPLPASMRRLKRVATQAAWALVSPFWWLGWFSTVARVADAAWALQQECADALHEWGRELLGLAHDVQFVLCGWESVPSGGGPRSRGPPDGSRDPGSGDPGSRDPGSDGSAREAGIWRSRAGEGGVVSTDCALRQRHRRFGAPSMHRRIANFVAVYACVALGLSESTQRAGAAVAVALLGLVALNGMRLYGVGYPDSVPPATQTVKHWSYRMTRKVMEQEQAAKSLSVATLGLSALPLVVCFLSFVLFPVAAPGGQTPPPSVVWSILAYNGVAVMMSLSGRLDYEAWIAYYWSQTLLRSHFVIVYGVPRFHRSILPPLCLWISYTVASCVIAVPLGRFPTAHIVAVKAMTCVAVFVGSGLGAGLNTSTDELRTLQFACNVVSHAVIIGYALANPRGDPVRVPIVRSVLEKSLSSPAEGGRAAVDAAAGAGRGPREERRGRRGPRRRGRG
jgi:hypothetical protein